MKLVGILCLGIVIGLFYVYITKLCVPAIKIASTQVLVKYTEDITKVCATQGGIKTYIPVMFDTGKLSVPSSILYICENGGTDK